MTFLRTRNDNPVMICDNSGTIIVAVYHEGDIKKMEFKGANLSSLKRIITSMTTDELLKFKKFVEEKQKQKTE
jgi:hypothetical protein